MIRLGRLAFGAAAVSFLLVASCKSTPQPASQDPSAANGNASGGPPALGDATDGGASSTASAGQGADGGGGGGGAACGPTTCKPGDVCCNDSCGICTPPGGFCTQQFCAGDAGIARAAGDAGADARDAGGSVRAGAACKADADCRTHASYCQDAPCACQALAKGDADPKCKGTGPQVQCFMNPCMKKAARCDGGHCVVTTAP